MVVSTAVILAGGRGTRFSEETSLRPKPMIEISGRPMLWHIMQWYSRFGVENFIVCAGYLGFVIKEYFANIALHNSDIAVDTRDGRIEFMSSSGHSWRVVVADTGQKTETGGRIRRVAQYLPESGPFFLTYGDGLADVNLDDLADRHLASGAEITLTAVQPPARFGALELDEKGLVQRFVEKPESNRSWVNGGYFMVDRVAVSRIDGDDTAWESDVLPDVSSEKKLLAYRHFGFWQPMDTLREKLLLEERVETGDAPWLLANRSAGDSSG